MKEPVWILQDTVIAIHQMSIAEHGSLNGIRDQTLLESALAQPLQRFSYGDHSSVFDLAASYAYGLAKNHPFVDGNKRVALTVSAVFLDLNGYTLDAPETDAVLIFNQLAEGSLSESDLSVWFSTSTLSE